MIAHYECIAEGLTEINFAANPRMLAYYCKSTESAA